MGPRREGGGYWQEAEARPYTKEWRCSATPRCSRSFKSCRRTFSSLLKDQNVEAEDRGKLMGHSGRSVTERNYTAHEVRRLAELVGRLPRVWVL